MGDGVGDAICSPQTVRIQSLMSRDWEEMDRGVMLIGVWMTVYGRPMWAQALYQLVEAEDCCAFLDECMVSIDFMPLRVDHESAAGRFLDDVMDGQDGPWSAYSVWAAHDDHVLGWLGLLQMCMKCMVDPDCDAEDLDPM